MHIIKIKVLSNEKSCISEVGNIKIHNSFFCSRVPENITNLERTLFSLCQLYLYLLYIFNYIFLCTGCEVIYHA